MRAIVGEHAEKIDGQIATSTDRIVRRVIPIASARISFGDLARFAWPRKAEAALSSLTRYDARTCRRWLAGDTEPPAEALGVVLAEIMKRFHQRD
jgi:hypothetical protein